MGYLRKVYNPEFTRAASRLASAGLYVEAKKMAMSITIIASDAQGI